jgi:FkbM family methyltransferase
MEYAINNKDGSGIFIQVGAGAGDLDNKFDCKDGFTEFIKNLPRERIKKIILVEANPMNIPKLRECWKDYPEATIYQLAIVPKNMKEDSITFYYHEDDGPHYQVTSVMKEHVLKHYSDESKVKTFRAPTKHLEDFIHEITTEEVELLALDIEGIDAEILLDIDYNNLKVKFLSFEYIHLGDNERKVKMNLIHNNFQYFGKGIDHNGYDLLFIRS